MASSSSFGMLSWVRRIASSGFFQSMVLATARNRHFVMLVAVSLVLSQLSAPAVSFALGQRESYSFLRSQKYAFPFFFFLIWTLFYTFRVVESPVLRFQRSFWNVHIVQRSQLTRMTFRPVFWAYNRHAQTVVCFILSFFECFFSDYRYLRETINSFDGRPQFLDWAVSRRDDGSTSEHLRRIDRGLNSRAPVVVLIHGLGDDRFIPYIQRFCRLCIGRGWRAVCWSYWRCDFSESRDLKCVVEHIQMKNPKAPVVAVGFSAGGHLLMRYLATYGDAVPLACAISVSGCFDFVQAFRDVCTNENPTYKVFLDIQQRKVIRRHLRNAKLSEKQRKDIECSIRTQGGVDLYDDVMRTLRPDLFRHEKSAAENGKSSLRPNRYSLRGKLGSVRVSTLVLHAEDDPVVSNQHYNWTEMAKNPHIVLCHTRRGGHVAHFDGLLPVGPTWADRACANFISAVLESQAQTSFIVNAVRKSLHDNPDPSQSIDEPAKVSRISSFANLEAALVNFSLPRSNSGGSYGHGLSSSG